MTTILEVLQKMDADLIAQTNNTNELLRLIYTLFGGTPVTPAHLAARVNNPARALRGTNSGRHFGIPGSNVTVTFTWDAPVDAGLTTGYILTIHSPDGSQFSQDVLSSGTSFVKSMPDDTGTYTATLVATGDPLTTLPSDPATTSFVPHTAAPPTKLATPSNFAATVT